MKIKMNNKKRLTRVFILMIFQVVISSPLIFRSYADEADATVQQLHNLDKQRKQLLGDYNRKKEELGSRHQTDMQAIELIQDEGDRETKRKQILQAYQEEQEVLTQQLREQITGLREQKDQVRGRERITGSSSESYEPKRTLPPDYEKRSKALEEKLRKEAASPKPVSYPKKQKPQMGKSKKNNKIFGAKKSNYKGS